MSYRATRRCVGIVGRSVGISSPLTHPWSARLIPQHRCFASPAAAQKTKEKPAVSVVAPSKPSKRPGRAQEPQNAAKENTASGRTVEDELRGVETLQRMTEMNEMDLSSAPLELLDLHVPTWRSYQAGATVMDHFRALIQAQRNWIFNVRALLRMAKASSVPGVVVRSHWSRQIFATQSTKPTAWLAPFRHTALEMYKEVNAAVASRDEKTIKILSVGVQNRAYIKLIRSQDPRFLNTWKFHGERTPCKVVSLRATEAYYGIKDPRVGSRLAIQAVVRFDTLQSVETFSNKNGARVGETEPKNVVEYLVFQKRMWSDSPWVIRDRLYEGLASRFTVPH